MGRTPVKALRLGDMTCHRYEESMGGRFTREASILDAAGLRPLLCVLIRIVSVSSSVLVQ
jgi:hypothetical protein